MYCETQKRFNVVVVKIPVNWLYETTENKLQGSGMTISKNASKVLKFTYFEITVCPPTSRLKFKCNIDTNYMIFMLSCSKCSWLSDPVIMSSYLFDSREIQGFDVLQEF